MPHGVPDGCPLTERQFAVATLLAEGRTPREVSRELNLSPTTVYQRVAAACKLLGIENRNRLLVAYMGAQGWTSWLPPIDSATPLAADSPFLAAYLSEFEGSRWPHEPDARSALGMKLALAGHRNTRRP